MATQRTMEPSPFSQRNGKAAKVTRLPVTLSISSPQTFSKPTMPLPRMGRWQGSQSGKSSCDGVARARLVLLDDAGQQRTRAVHADGRRQRVVERLAVDADALDADLEQLLAALGTMPGD